MTKLEKDEKRLRFVESNMKFEGFPLTENTKTVCKKILKKEVSGNEIVSACILKCKKGTL